MDPFTILSTQIFSRIISFLPPRDVQSCRDVSKSWREAIATQLDDSVDFNAQTQREIVNSEESLVIQDLNQLTSPPDTQVVKLTLNLSSLFQDLTASDKPQEEMAFKRFQSFIQPLNHTLKEVNIEGKEHMSGAVHDLLLTLIYSLLAEFSQMERIRIDVPSIFSLKAGLASSGNKFFSITANGSREGLNFEALPGLMKGIESFVGTGTGLTEFKLPLYYEIQYRWENVVWSEKDAVGTSKLLGELSRSRKSLQVLDLYGLGDVKGKNLWNLFIQCPHLTSLSVSLQDPTRKQKDVEWLEVSERDVVNRCKKLTKLDLEASGYAIEWDSFSKWIGEGELEEIELGRAYSLSSKCLESLLSNSRANLKTIILRNSRTDRFSFRDQSSLSNQTFPNLETLRLVTQVPFWLKIFKTLRSPKLKVLDIFYDFRPFPSDDDATVFFESVTSLLQLHSQTLVEFEFDYDILLPQLSILFKEGISVFPNLEKMRFREVNLDAFMVWLTRSHFPKLSEIDDPRQFAPELYEAFRANAPNLPEVSEDEDEDEDE